MILNYKPQFAPWIIDGSKTHTIRAERTDRKRPKPNETLHHYQGLRQPNPTLLLRAPCIRTEDINIEYDRETALKVKVAGVFLDWREAAELFKRDGFRDPNYLVSTAEAYQWWKDRLPFRGWITYWIYAK